jgi:hypothetical protein
MICLYGGLFQAVGPTQLRCEEGFAFFLSEPELNQTPYFIFEGFMIEESST